MLKLLCGCILASGLGRAVAQNNTVNISYLEGQVPVAPDAVTTLGPELFGDRVNLFNGALEFEHTDLQLPGNNTLEVALRRRHTPGRSIYVRGQLADWDLDTPRIGGSFLVASGWVTWSGGSNRCSGFSAPLATSPWGFLDRDFWHGTHLNVPGQGGQEVLSRSVTFNTPTDGGIYPLVTHGNWQIGCLQTIQNGSGEGFTALSPQGVRYRFDWMAQRGQTSVKNSRGSAARNDIYLMATEVTDRHGNWVRYSYDPASPMNLLRIESNDGRLITLSYAAGRLASASDGTRTFSYSYNAQGDLANVLQPDGSSWTFNLRPMVIANMNGVGENANCDGPGDFPADGDIQPGTIIHPSGATGSFNTQFRLLGRSYVQRVCNYVLGTTGRTTGSRWPRSQLGQSLISKQITGPGMPAMTWTYAYASQPSWDTCTTCSDKRTVTVTHPGGNVSVHTFGTRWRVDEGRLLRLDEGWSGAPPLKTTTYRYRAATGQAYPAAFGTSPFSNADWLSFTNRPMDQRVVTQQGVEFKWEVDANTDPLVGGFDNYARARRVTRSSGLGMSKTETTVYSDNTSKWVMGQVASVTDHLGGVPQLTVYDPTTALPTARYSFGLLLQTYEYSHDGLGTLFRIFDPLGRATTLENYRRGIPRLFTHRDGVQERAEVNNLGKVDWHTDAAGFTTSYGYDSMGRLARITPPAEASFQYHPYFNYFEPVAADEYGLAPGHWRQTTIMGNARTDRYYDALWRVRLVRSRDTTDEANTAKLVETRYDPDGHKTFVSYPQRSLAAVDMVGTYGKSWTFDLLGREIATRQDSEVGPLFTTTAYLVGFQRLFTNARGFATTFAYQAFDQPSQDHIRTIWAPESTKVDISRDIYGKPNFITRSGSYAGAAQQATRSYFYDGHQRLCKTIEPETAATVQGYDGAGNLAWRASGQAPNSPCDESAAPAARVRFSYDARDRLMLTGYDDGSPGIGRSYTPDGLLAATWSGGTQWNYTYNNRRLLTQETLYSANTGQSYSFTRGIEPHGNLASLSYPGLTVQYAPNALGQPTQVSGYVNIDSVRYEPNGGVASYTLANGVVHTVTQNLRGLPEWWSDGNLVYDRYFYDSNGNVSSISDERVWSDVVNEGNGGRATRVMGYDGLDRLKTTSGSWGQGLYDYDALDNLRSSTVGSRTAVSTLDPAGTNRLSQLNVNGQVLNFGYDPNGNLTSRGAQGFAFDLGNRLTTATGKASYGYDGHGRRAWVAYNSGATRLQAYGQAGKLLLSVDSLRGTTSHIYLGDKLIAEVNSQGGNTTTSFSHTDALGSPVAVTNGSGLALSRTRYEPYGATAVGTNPAGIGFTGHVNDGDTGLVYMQQRYYDPIAGRFLSVDPVTTDAATGSSFNRYVYGNNNPYRFVDPDGRQSFSVSIQGGFSATLFKGDGLGVMGSKGKELQGFSIAISGAAASTSDGYQISLSVSGVELQGAGAYVGGGPAFAGAAGNGPAKAGIDSSPIETREAGVMAAGAQATKDSSGGSLGTGLRGGVGAGGYVAAGSGSQTTLATPTTGQMFRSLVSAVKSLIGGKEEPKSSPSSDKR